MSKKSLEEIIENHFDGGCKGWFKYKDEHLPYLIYIGTGWGYDRDAYRWSLRIFSDISPFENLKISSIEYDNTQAKLIACETLKGYTKKLIHKLRKDYDDDVIKKVELLIVRSVTKKYNDTWFICKPKEWIEKIIKTCDKKRKSLLGYKGYKGWVEENIKIIHKEKGYNYE